jgi:prepilin-type N-terminal cleavage/methylation domain-containing protein
MKINKKGFTLIELLVVIAIIGLLSTMAVVSLNSARMKSRDARRLSDVRQLSTMMSMASTNSSDPIVCRNPGTATTGTGNCEAGDLTVDVTTPTELSEEFQKFHDPSMTETQWPTANLACAAASTAPCNYAFKGMTDVSSSTIYFFLEKGTGDMLGDRTHWINSDGVFNQ